MDDAPDRKRRWFQHSRRWPLLLLLPLLIPCVWFVMKMEHAAKQKAVVEELENLGGLVWYDYQFEADGAPSSKDPQPPGPFWLRRLLGDDFFINVTKLDLRQTEVGDAGLAHLNALADLESLTLGERAGDVGLEHLKGLPLLHTLNLRATRVTDAGLVHLQALPHLRSLDLRDTRVTDAGLQELRKALPNCAIAHP